MLLHLPRGAGAKRGRRDTGKDRELAQRFTLGLLVLRERCARGAATQVRDEAGALARGELAVELAGDGALRLRAGELLLERVDEAERHIP